MLSRFSCVRLFATLWTVAHQTPQSMGFSKQEYWSVLPCPSLEGLPRPVVEPVSLMSPAFGRPVLLLPVSPGKPISYEVGTDNSDRNTMKQVPS